MAMSVGSGSSGDPEVMVDINTTPLIDVMLVLLIMLIITIPIQTHAVKLNMPVGNPPPPPTPPVQPEVHLRPNKLVTYKHVAHVMAAAQRLGVTKIGLIGAEQFLD
jgi:biopolymer transport protein ExbD